MSEIVKLADSDRFLVMEQVADLKFKNLSDTAVAKELGIKRVQVKELFDEYKDALASNTEARDMAIDQLHLMVEHYNRLIKKLYDLLDELEGENLTAPVAAQRNAAIKQIADMEARRLEALQKAGILDASDLGDELARMEEQRDTVVNILRNELCAACRRKVMGELSNIMNRTEVVVVHE